jgi:ankyrin repeat protein
MKHLLLTTIAAVVLVGCGNPEADRAADRALIDAAYAGNVEAVKQHLAAGTDVNTKGKYGKAPLHYAATKEMLELLIAKGADVNVKDKDGGTPLHYAAKYGRKETVELLIAKGVNVNAKNDYGETPLDQAITRSRTKIADLLRKLGGKTAKELKAEQN